MPDNLKSGSESMKRIIYTLLLTSLYTLSFSQKATISGYVKDAANGEDVIGANVFIDELMKGTTTNIYGFYSLTLDTGKYTLIVSYLGYTNYFSEITLTEDIRLNIDLNKSAIQTEQVEISAEAKDKNVSSTDVGKVELSTETIKALPALFGEVDILKTIQLLPGIQSAGEGNAGFYVRGGGPDQNLILLDNAVVYNTGHLFGFFSVFNSDAIKNTTVIKGGMPAEYGGRLSSVVDLSMKEGNMKKWQAEGGIGLISSRLTLQGPLKKDRASILVSARRTYADLLARPVLNNRNDGELAGNTYYFYDINAKINYKFSDKDRIYLSGYFGRDVFRFRSPSDNFSFDFPWGNSTATLRWNHLFSDKLFMNATAIYNDYQFDITSIFSDVEFRLSSGIRDWSGKVDFDYFPHPDHKVKIGAQYTHHTFTPYIADGNQGDVEFSTDLTNKLAHEVGIYVQDEWEIYERLSVNAGLRLSYFANVGPGQKILFDPETGQATDTLTYKRHEKIADYWSIEPRINARFMVDEFSSLKFGFTYNTQYVHLATSATTTLPTDLWVPSTAVVEPQRGYQFSLGYYRNFANNMIEASVEGYYKKMRNQIEFCEGCNAELNEDIEDSFVFGNGESYGVEFFVRKNAGSWTGWIGYTLSWTDRTFPDINGGESFWAKYDRRHDLSAVVIYDISPKWRISSIFVYGTGQTTTPAIGRYFIEGEVVNQYGDRNSYRLVPYHRLDFSASLILKNNEKRYSDITVSIYNIYNRKNPFFIYNDIEGDVNSGDLAVQAKQVSLFGIIPSFTWNFRF